MTIQNYDEWKLRPYDDEPVIACLCDHCNDEIFVGEDCIDTVDGTRLHTDCFDEYARSLLIAYCGPAEEPSNESY